MLPRPQKKQAKQLLNKPEKRFKPEPTAKRSFPFPFVAPPSDPVIIGRIARSIGFKGELKVIFESEDPDRLADLDQVSVRVREGCFLFDIVLSLPFAGFARVTFKGVDTTEKAELLRNGELIVSNEELPDLEGGEYYASKLEGSQVIAEDGEDLGKLEEIIFQGHHDLWCVRGIHGEILIPARKEFIVGVDLENRVVTVKRIPGLWEGA